MHAFRFIQRLGTGSHGKWAGLVFLAVLNLVLPEVWAAERESKVSVSRRWMPSEPPNQPIGQARGIYPGRVVWIHNPKAAQWKGQASGGGWFEDRFTDPARAEQMLNQAILMLTGASNISEGWTGLFRHFNRTHGRGDAGYRPGEKVAIKLNLNCSQRSADPRQGLYNTPQLTRALLRQLVKEAGVRETDIVACDASRLVSDSLYLPLHREFPGIRFEDRDGGQGRFQVRPDKNTSLHFGAPGIRDNGKTYLPDCFTKATYLINAAVMKGHVLAGVTLCAKNHFGSVYRENTGSKDPHQGWNPSPLHEAVTVRNRPMGSYNPLVDLMGHRDLGGKTILYLIDALYAAPHQNEGPQRWKSAPFNGHWTASVFVSQDPVAMESVAVDFFAAEKNAVHLVGAVDNYLHEAARANHPPSGARYDPEGDGKPLESLGVHEHWNNPLKKQYSRNLGNGKGIELLEGRGATD